MFRTNAQLFDDLRREEHDFNVAHGCTCYIGEREECPLHGTPEPQVEDIYTTEEQF
jgi:hypothetical protein